MIYWSFWDIMMRRQLPDLAVPSSSIYAPKIQKFTAGCVAVLRDHMIEILANSSRGMALAITRQAPAEPLSK